MSIVAPAAASTPASNAAETPPARPRRPVRWRRWLILAGLLVGGGSAAAFYGTKAYRALSASSQGAVPTAIVQRGDLSLEVTARGSIAGGNPEMLTAPMTGGSDMHITELRRTGEQVKAGDVVVQFDITEQEYKLKEAEADLAEADQHLIQAKAQRDADQEEDRYALLTAKTDVTSAELDVQKNPIKPAITAKQNDLALAAAKDHLAQLEQNLANRKATNDAAIAMQEAGRGKAEAQGATARQNIEAMTLRAHRSGYVALHQNSSGNFFFFGMTLPLYQMGDTVRPGMAVAEIPDMSSWELSAVIDELDRGHIALGDKVAITIIALPEHAFAGHVKEIGGTTGPPWNRRFECKIALDDPAPDLRPGMSAEIVITTDQMKQVLWLPAQALFESDGRTFVYLRSGATFAAHDVKLVRRNETRVVVTGVNAGQVVALANPLETAKKKSASSSALQSLPK